MLTGRSTRPRWQQPWGTTRVHVGPASAARRHHPRGKRTFPVGAPWVQAARPKNRKALPNLSPGASLILSAVRRRRLVRTGRRARIVLSSCATRHRPARGLTPTLSSRQESKRASKSPTVTSVHRRRKPHSPRSRAQSALGGQGSNLQQPAPKTRPGLQGLTVQFADLRVVRHPTCGPVAWCV